MTDVEESTSFTQPSGSDLTNNASQYLVQNALEANKQLQRLLIHRAEELEAKLNEADQLLAAAAVEESQDEPESEILIPGAKKAIGLFPLTDLLNPVSPFYEDATKRSSYVTNTNPHSFKAKDIEILCAAVRQENERIQAYRKSQDPSSESWQAIDLEKNTEGLDWSRIAEKVSDASSVKRTAIDCQIVWTADKHPAVNHAEWSEDELNKLNLLVSQYTKEKTAVDWVKIAENLETHRVPIDCMRHGMLRCRHNWSPEMDEKLVQTVELCGQDNWQLVARKVSENVSAGQCQNRWQKALNPMLQKGAWTEDEDERLRKAVAIYGPSWIQVAAAIPGRTNDQCRERWTENVNQAPTKMLWTEDEDRILLDSVKEHGNQWKVISLKIGNNKTGQNCRLRYDKLMKKANKKSGGSSSASRTTFISSALSQLVEGQGTSSPLINNHEFIPHLAIRPIAAKSLSMAKLKGKGKEKASSIDTLSQASQLHGSSNTLNLMDTTAGPASAQPDHSGTIPIRDGDTHEPVLKPRPRPRPKAKGNALETIQSASVPDGGGSANDSQPLPATAISDVGHDLLVDMTATRSSKRKAVDEENSANDPQLKKTKTLLLEPIQQAEPPQAPPDIVSPTPQQPKKRGRPRKVIQPPEMALQQDAIPTPGRQTRAQARATRLDHGP